MDIKEKIMGHLDLLESGIEVSQKMLKRAEFGDLERVEFLSGNRERLMSLISKSQEAVERELLEVGINQLQREVYDIAKSWAQDVTDWIQIIADYDNQILVALNQHKEKTKLQISESFKAKQQFKGYNLSSTKK